MTRNGQGWTAWLQSRQKNVITYLATEVLYDELTKFPIVVTTECLRQQVLLEKLLDLQCSGDYERVRA